MSYCWAPYLLLCTLPTSSQRNLLFFEFTTTLALTSTCKETPSAPNYKTRVHIPKFWNWISCCYRWHKLNRIIADMSPKLNHILCTNKDGCESPPCNVMYSTMKAPLLPKSQNLLRNPGWCSVTCSLKIVATNVDGNWHNEIGDKQLVYLTCTARKKEKKMPLPFR